MEFNRLSPRRKETADLALFLLSFFLSSSEGHVFILLCTNFEVGFWISQNLLDKTENSKLDSFWIFYWLLLSFFVKMLTNEFSFYFSCIFYFPYLYFISFVFSSLKYLWTFPLKFSYLIAGSLLTFSRSYSEEIPWGSVSKKVICEFVDKQALWFFSLLLSVRTLVLFSIFLIAIWFISWLALVIKADPSSDRYLITFFIYKGSIFLLIWPMM